MWWELVSATKGKELFAYHFKLPFLINWYLPMNICKNMVGLKQAKLTAAVAKIKLSINVVYTFFALLHFAKFLLLFLSMDKTRGLITGSFVHKD